MLASLTVSHQQRFLLATIAVLASFLSIIITPVQAFAASARELNAQVQDTLVKFRSEVPGGSAVLSKAKGVLVLPKIYKAGMGVGVEYGEGALLVGGRTVDYYNMAAGSMGWQLGAQKKSLVMIFLDGQALEGFRLSRGWKAGVDASIAVIKAGAEASLGTDVYNRPIVAYVVDQKGLMVDFSLEGAKFSKINKR